jgi:hypothetical protein
VPAGPRFAVLVRDVPAAGRGCLSPAPTSRQVKSAAPRSRTVAQASSAPWIRRRAARVIEPSRRASGRRMSGPRRDCRFRGSAKALPDIGRRIDCDGCLHRFCWGAGLSTPGHQLHPERRRIGGLLMGASADHQQCDHQQDSPHETTPFHCAVVLATAPCVSPARSSLHGSCHAEAKPPGASPIPIQRPELPIPRSRGIREGHGVLLTSETCLSLSR